MSFPVSSLVASSAGDDEEEPDAGEEELAEPVAAERDLAREITGMIGTRQGWLSRCVDEERKQRFGCSAKDAGLGHHALRQGVGE